jgi:hypothetical protein
MPSPAMTGRRSSVNGNAPAIPPAAEPPGSAAGAAGLPVGALVPGNPLPAFRRWSLTAARAVRSAAIGVTEDAPRIQAAQVCRRGRGNAATSSGVGTTTGRSPRQASRHCGRSGTTNRHQP